MRKVKPKSYEYIENLSEAENDLQIKARKNSEKLGLDGISLSKTEAHILKFLVKDIQAKKIVEIGTLTGLSALYLLDGAPEEACVWTLEKSEEHMKMASEVLSEFVNKNKCKLVVGDAKEKLKEISAQGPFDAVFIDGNKAAYLDYFNWAVENIRVVGLIVVDNVFLAGSVWGDQTTQKFNDKQIRIVNEMNQQAYKNNKLNSMILPTDEGMLICKKLS